MVKTTKTVTGKKWITPRARLSFPFLFTPDSSDMGRGKFVCTLLFDKSDQNVLKELKAQKAECQRIGKEAFGDAKVKLPFANGDEKELDGYKGMVYVKPTSKYRPNVVTAKDPNVPAEESDVYAGCYVRASLVPFTYDQKGNKGVSYRLCNVQKLADGEKFGGGAQDAAEDFGPVDVDESKPFEADAAGDDDDNTGF